MSGLDAFYRSLGVGGGKKNPYRRSIRNPKAAYSLARLQNDLARLPTYHESIAEVHDALERALRKHGLSLAGYVDQAVPYDQTRMMILPTSDPMLYLSVQIYRTPNGRYELTTYATRDARRRRNPEDDVEDTAAEYIIRGLIQMWRSDVMSGGSAYEEAIPLGKGAAMIVRPAQTYEERGSVLFDVYFWTEAGGAGGEWRRNSDVYYEPMVSSDDWNLSDLKEALHYAMHHKTLRGFRPVHSKVTDKALPPETRFGIMRNPGEEEPTEFEVDADVPAGTGEEPPELPRPELALDRAEGIYEEFHGKPSGELIETEEEVRLRDTLAVLGRLAQIIVESADAARYSITFGDDTMLCVSDDGKQLYAVGGDQSLDLEALGVSGPAAEKDKVFVGSALQVTYRTRKQFDDFAEVDYVHDFGEDGGTLPLLVYDRLNQTVEFAGGDYEIKREGIVN